MVQRMAGPEGISAWSLAKEVGISQSTLSRWLRQRRTLTPMSDSNPKGGAPRSRKRTAEEKLRLLNEASSVGKDGLGAFLRREGIHEPELEAWRLEALAGLAKARAATSKTSPDARKIRALEKELARKEKALAEVAALLTLKKKAQEIWGDGDDDTRTKSGT
jgi:transposase-like protein